MLFPAVDPIPLPAPVWLFKSLHILTLALHFVAVKMLLGGLLVATVLSFFKSPNDPRRHAAASLSKRLPVVMTYVINLGVPPLLFAQVLYGPALYTSNVLIGFYWIMIVFLLMACYWFLYAFSDGLAEGKSVWWKGLAAFILAGCISRILSTNMALMLRPEVWPQMYAASPAGAALPPYDSTLDPRWLFMLTGAGWTAGLWMIWIAGRKTVKAPLNAYLSSLGGKLAAVMVLIQGVFYYLILVRQPSGIVGGLMDHALYRTAVLLWVVLAVCIFCFALWSAIKKPCGYAASYLALGLTVLSIASWTIVRDGIRDLSLNVKGFDVWQQTVVTNWEVVGWFFLTFGGGLIALVWLISVMMRAKPIAEGGL